MHEVYENTVRFEETDARGIVPDGTEEMLHVNLALAPCRCSPLDDSRQRLTIRRPTIEFETVGQR